MAIGTFHYPSFDFFGKSSFLTNLPHVGQIADLQTLSNNHYEKVYMVIVLVGKIEFKRSISILLTKVSYRKYSTRYPVKSTENRPGL